MLKHIPPVGSSTGQQTSATVTSPITTNANTNRSSRSLLNRSQQPLNVSTLSTNTLNGTLNGGIGSPTLLQTHHNHHQHTPFQHAQQHNKLLNGHVPRIPSFTTPLPSLSSNSNHQLLNNSSSNTVLNVNDRCGAREALTSLGLLCLVSLLLALLSLIFLLKISPGGRDLPPSPPPPSQQSLLGPSSPEEYAIVYDVTLALCALSLSLNLCCLLVCAIQFLFAVKLIRAPPVSANERGNKYLQKSSVSRVCAVGGFFISIPIFLTGIILYTFTQFHSTPAIVTSILIGVGIVFCGGAMVHNVFIWQKEKTISVQAKHKQQQLALQQQQQHANNNNHYPHHLNMHSMHQNSRQTPLNLNLSMNSPISTITTPFLSHSHHDNINNHSYVNGGIGNLNTTLNNTHTSQMGQVKQLTPVTPLSANQSHMSFNHNPPYISSTFGLRTTATPPTPKMPNGHVVSRDASGSISPGTTTAALELSNILELSTLV